MANLTDFIEEWRPVVGHEVSHEVSNLGRVRSIDRITSHPTCGRLTLKGRLTSINYELHKYPRVSLYHDKGKKTIALHIIVAKAFIPNPQNKPEVNHIDGDKNNHSISNLEWVTESENQFHAYRTGLKIASHHPCGEDHPNAKLSNADVETIRGLLNEGELSTYKIAERFGVSQSRVAQIKTGLRTKG